MSTLDASKLSNEELKDAFMESFKEQIAIKFKIDEFEVDVARDHNKCQIGFEVVVIGFAGAPSIDAFRKDIDPDLETLILKVPSYGEMSLHLDPEKTTFLSAGDYSVYYSNY